MEIGVAEAAERLGVSPRRVHQLIDAGRIQGRKVGGTWLVEASSLHRPVVRSRPMSLRMAWGLVAVLSGLPPEDVDPRERLRLRRAAAGLRADSDPASLLRSWLAGRAPLVSMSVRLSDIAALASDPRLALSGISDDRAGMSAAAEVEAYVDPLDAEDVILDHMLSGVGQPNVFLHLSARPPGPVPIGLVLADLADHNGPREDKRVIEILASLP